MADYYPLIRRAVYDRARTTLVAQLHRLDPPLLETTLEHERLALEDAIGKVEVDAILTEVLSPIPDHLKIQSNDWKSGSNSQQTQPTDNPSKQLEDYFATVKASLAQLWVPLVSPSFGIVAVILAVVISGRAKKLAKMQPRMKSNKRPRTNRSG